MVRPYGQLRGAGSGFLNTEGTESSEKRRNEKQMSYENILYEKRDGIAFITFNRPKVLNALNRQTVEELRDALLDAKKDDAVRVLILTGAGEKSFVAGADIGELAQQTPMRGKEFSLFGQSVFHLLETMGKPSICAINGFALGGGCEVAMACSIRLASKTAKLGQPEVKLGIIPGYGGTQRLARLCGKGAAHELCLTGEMITADEAQRIGLVNHVYEAAELLPAAEALAKKIIANAPIAVKYTLEAIERGIEMPQEEGLFLEATLFGLSCATEDMKEGTKAFLEKRKAEFQGK
jgi:enoyl-CoA hydratase/carnithine racemase